MLSNNPTESATALLALGIAPMPVQWKAKLPMMKAWQKEYPCTPDDLPAYFDAQDLNIGAVLGAASGGKVDVDMDWPECERLAPLFLPQSWTFGRQVDGSLQVRHIMLQCPDIQTLRLTAPPSMRMSGDKARIVEVLSTGTFVVAPGSIYADGQPIQWISWPSHIPLAEMDAATLTQAVQRMAGAALMARLWPELEGARHDVLLTLAGSMAHAGWQHNQIAAVLWGVVNIGRDSEKNDRKKAIFDTLSNISNGAAVTGLPRLSGYLAADVVDCLVKWWQLGSSDVALTFGGEPVEQMTAMTAVSTPCTVWPELLEFESLEDTASAIEYPISALGPVMSRATAALVDIQQVPVALAAQSVLTAAATPIQSRYNVIRDDVAIPLSIWLVLIAVAGERKTSTDILAMERLFMRLQEAREVFEITLSGWKASCADKETDPGPKPREPAWIYSTGSTEGFLKSLGNKWPAITLTNSDTGTWLGGYSMREGRETSTAAAFSSLWSGALHAGVLASEEGSMLKNRRLSLSLMLQPEVATQLFGNTMMASQGFLSRCLPAFPASTMGTRIYRPNIDKRPLQAFHDRLDELLTIPVDMNPLTGDLKFHAMHLTPDAHQLWVDIYNAYERSLLSDHEITEVTNKMSEQVLRLAAFRLLWKMLKVLLLRISRMAVRLWITILDSGKHSLESWWPAVKK